MYRKIRSVTLAPLTNGTLMVDEHQNARLTVEAANMNATFDCSHKALRQLCSMKNDGSKTPFYSVYPAEIALPGASLTQSFETPEQDEAAYSIIRMLKLSDPWNWSFSLSYWKEYCRENCVGLSSDFGGLETLALPMLDIQLSQIVTMTPIFAAKTHLAYLEWEFWEAESMPARAMIRS